MWITMLINFSKHVENHNASSTLDISTGLLIGNFKVFHQYMTERNRNLLSLHRLNIEVSETER